MIWRLEGLRGLEARDDEAGLWRRNEVIGSPLWSRDKGVRGFEGKGKSDRRCDEGRREGVRDTVEGAIEATRLICVYAPYGES